MSTRVLVAIHLRMCLNPLPDHAYATTGISLSQTLQAANLAILLVELVAALPQTAYPAIQMRGQSPLHASVMRTTILTLILTTVRSVIPAAMSAQVLESVPRAIPTPISLPLPASVTQADLQTQMLQFALCVQDYALLVTTETQATATHVSLIPPC